MKEECYKNAKKMIENNNNDIGLLAGEYFKEVWGRDALISCLGMCVSKDKKMLNISKKTIDSIAYRENSGEIPNFFTSDMIDYGETGCVDSSLWYPIAVYFYFSATKDYEFLNKHFKIIEKVINWIKQLDANKDGFIEVPECSDWMDLLSRSGRVLYDEILYYAALMYTSKIAWELNDCSAYIYEKKANELKKKINSFFWFSQKNLDNMKKTGNKDFGSSSTDYIFSFKEIPYYAAEIGFRRADTRCDVFANTLALFFGVPDKDKEKQILNFFNENKVYEPYPVKVLIPPIEKKDPDWSIHYRIPLPPRMDLMDPGNSHNGGIWPFVGGFYVAMLAKKDKNLAETLLEKLAEVNSINNWEFNEWLTSNGKISGKKHQTWNAGTYLLAYHYVKNQMR